MSSQISQNNTFQIPDSAKLFMNSWILKSRKTLWEQEVDVRKKIQDLDSLLSQFQTQRENTSQNTVQFIPSIKKATESFNVLYKKTSSHLDSVEKKICHLQAHLEEDRKFEQNMLSYEISIKEKMETLDSSFSDQFSSITRKIQKSASLFTSAIEHLKSTEQTLSSHLTNLDHRHNEFCLKFIQDQELSKVKTQQITQSLKQFSNEKKTKTDNSLKTIAQAAPAQQKDPPKNGPEILNNLLSGGLDLVDAESQLTSLFERAFLAPKLTASQKTDLNMAQELLEPILIQSSNTIEDPTSSYVQKLLLSKEINPELIQKTLVSTLTEQTNDYQLVECVGPARQPSNKTHKELVSEVQKALIRSFLEEKSQTSIFKNMPPNSIEEIGYSLNFSNLLRRCAQKGNLFLIVNKRTQIGMPLKIGAQIL